MTKRQIPPQIRQFCYKRDQNACQEPGCKLTRDNGGVMNLHHIRPEQFGGQETPSNLITLCDIHHKNMHSEFSAFYPDSKGVLKRMNHYMSNLLTKIRNLAKIDDGSDLKFYLRLLTGQDNFRLGQLEAIRATSQGRDVLFVTPTGSGKSVCYQIPTLLSSKPALVISPLKTLMKDQTESICKKKIPATYINSDLSTGEIKNRYDFIKNDLYKFIFVAPERFQSKDPNTNSLYTDYSYFIVDEAHEIEMWGMAFRPSYKLLGELRTKLNRPPIIALTATASKSTQEHILKSLKAQNPKIIVTGFYKDNIEIKKEPFNKWPDKFKYVERVIAENPSEKILIFTPTVSRGEELLKHLQKQKIEVKFFHSKLDNKNKMHLQNMFTGVEKPELQVLISTSAFGMGIDIPNIRHIIHLTPALSLTDYVQQIGRAGRDNQQSYAHLLYMHDDKLLRFMLKKQLQQPDFKTKHDYSDYDMIEVEKKLMSQLDDMFELIRRYPGSEWQYIQDYFGETQFSQWQNYGKTIINIGFTIFIGLIILVLIILLLGIIT